MKKLLLTILSLTTIFIALNVQSIAIAAEPVFTTYLNHTDNQNKWIIQEGNPGSSLQNSITVKNLSNESIDLNLSFEESEGSTKKMHLLGEKKYQNLGKWINLETSKVRLAAHETKNINFEIKVPNDTNPGKYQGAVLVTYTDNSNRQLNLATRIGNRIYLTVSNNKDLQNNVSSPEINSLQIILIILSCVGIAFGLSKNKSKNNES